MAVHGGGREGVKRDGAGARKDVGAVEWPLLLTGGVVGGGEGSRKVKATVSTVAFEWREMGCTYTSRAYMLIRTSLSSKDKRLTPNTKNFCQEGCV